MLASRRRRAVLLVAGVVLLTGLGAVLSSVGWRAAAGGPGDCAATASAADPGVRIADPRCEYNGTSYDGRFGPAATSAGQRTRTWTGIAPDGAAYRIEVPPKWNGTLVMYAHGYHGTSDTVWPEDPSLRQYYIDHGYAWAASSYAKNGWDPADGVTDTHDLLRAFGPVTGLRYRQAIMTGESMGGEVTAAEIERYRGQYAAAMPACGALDGPGLFGFDRGASTAAAALTGTSIRYPTTTAAGRAYQPRYISAAESELPALGITPRRGGKAFSTDLTPAGRRWADAVERLSGGTRPGFTSALSSYWDSFGFTPVPGIPFLLGLYPGLHEFADASADSGATLPAVHGNPGIPVLSLHGIDDLFVPFSMDQAYDRAMIAHGEGNLFVGRAIRETAHCQFTVPELSSAFSALMTWVDHGPKPAGDDILNPQAVASPTFGCRFTDPAPGAHPGFTGGPCPPGAKPGAK